MTRFDLWRVAALVLVALGVLPAAGCGGSASNEPSAKAPANGPELTAVTLQLNWFPESEHGGYFEALVKGYYREAGLDVKILPGGIDTPVIQLVTRGDCTFGIVNADNILFGRAQQAPVVAVMAPLQNSPRCIMVHESSGIQNFDELKNMTIAMSPSNAFSTYLRHKLPLTGVKIVPYSGNVAMFLIDKNYAQQAYVFSEPFVARQQGGDPKVLMVSELGYNPYSSVLFTSDNEVAKRPDVVRKMVAASVRGWASYVQSPDETNQYIHKINPEMNLDVLDYGVGSLRPLVLADEARSEGIGVMTLKRWQTLADQLIDTDQLNAGAVDPAAVFTDRFLPAKEPTSK